MADLRKLKQEALEATTNGNWRKAATCYANLERREPTDPAWALKLGECLRRMGNNEEAIKAFSRSAIGYAKGDVLLKAIAVCKIILGIDAKHTHTQQLLASLHAAQGTGPAQAVPSRPAAPSTEPVAPPTRPSPPPLPPRPPVAPAVAPSPAAAAPAKPAAPPPLPQLKLAALIPGAQQSAQIGSTGSSTAMRIPIDDAFVAAATTASGNPHKGAGRNTMARFVLPKTPFFSVLTPELFRMAVERVRLIQLAAGEILFAKGDAGDALFVVAWGEIAILVPQEVARLSEGDFFGEIALLADRPRTATARATVDTQVLALDRPLLNDLITASPDLLKVLLRFLRERLMATLAETSPIFAPFTALERIGLAARFQFVEIDDGLRMVEEGARSPGLFVLLAGAADVVAGGRLVGRLAAGDVFGEISLIAGQVAAGDVVARGKCFVLFLPRAEFSEVIMTHPQVLEHISTVAEARSREIGRVNML
ncbi:MAG: cyclic nucleotide-binding domain-containing protein [Deltaproteobacteria bacterium]|nr:cyclic nucleotide-binding domain-containing protein [Deltaproteobacteria bacterium]